MSYEKMIQRQIKEHKEAMLRTDRKGKCHLIKKRGWCWVCGKKEMLPSPPQTPGSSGLFTKLRPYGKYYFMSTTWRYH